MDTSPRIYPWKKPRILWLFQAPGFRQGVNLKSKINNGLFVDQNPKLNDFMGLKACD